MKRICMLCLLVALCLAACSQQNTEPVQDTTESGTTVHEHVPNGADCQSALLCSDCGEVLAERTLAECDVMEDVITVTLTQKETLSFVAGERVQIQVRALTQKGEAFASRILRVGVTDCLCEEVLA